MTIEKITKRQFLQSLGASAGAAAVYRGMAALGLVSLATSSRASSPAPRDAGKGKRVIILGAGIAGLTAAYELSKTGYGVTILEATARAGGRSLTVRGGDRITEFKSTQRVDFDDEAHLYANLGPARIPYHHQTILGYCKEFGVELEVFTNDNRAAFFQSPDSFDGKPVVARQLHTDQRGYIAELLAKAVHGNALDEELTEEDKERLLDLLKGFGNLSDDYQYGGSGRAGYQGEHVHQGLGGATPVSPFTLKQVLGYDLSWYTTYFTHSVNQNPTLFQPVGGMDAIVEAFKVRVGRLIRYQSIVTRIDNLTDGVRIAYRNKEGVMESLEADFAVCTIPATVLRDIPNNFAAETQNAIASTPYDTAFKIAFQTRRRFWEEDHAIYGGISWTTPSGVEQIWYPSYGYHRKKGVILGSYLFGAEGFDRESSLRFAAMSPQERLEAAIAHGDQVHPGYRAELESGVSRAWSEVPFQKGSWPSRAPVEALQKPDGAIYFAGDHTSALSGWQEGSALAALATVNAIHECVMA